MAVRIDTSHLLSQQTWANTTTGTTQPLLNSTILVHSVTTPKREGSCFGLHYRIQCIKSKGALIVLIWGFILHLAIPFNTAVHLLKLSLDVVAPHNHTFHSFLQSRALYRALFILYPLMGWIADAKIGRYRTILASIISIFIASVLMVVGYLIHIYTHSLALQILVTVLLGIGVLFNIVGFACFDANVIPFLTDQVLGASGENLSALIHWHFWFSALSEIVNVTLNISSIELGDQYLTLGILIVHFLCVLTVLVSCFLFKHWLDTTPQITNPIKLIVKVLKYAFHNTYPKNRSALTYWEEVSPSRVDLGKEKYGGPFSEEEVEDVKTSLRLLPLVFLSVGYGLMISQSTYIHYLQQPIIDSKPAEIAMKLVQSEGFQYGFCTLSFIVLFHFFIYPCFYNYIPSVLKRIGFGLLLTFLHLIYLTVLDPIAQSQEHDNNRTCLLVNATSTDELSLQYYWGLPVVTLGAFSELCVVPFVFEFIVAQTPGPMKGLMIGLWFAFYGIMQLCGIYIYIPFKEIPGSSTPSCTFYYYFTKTFLSAVVFLTFTVLAYRYKMRTRDVPINFNMLAENHYCKYLSINESYIRDTSQVVDSDTSSCSSCD